MTNSGGPDGQDPMRIGGVGGVSRSGATSAADGVDEAEAAKGVEGTEEITGAAGADAVAEALGSGAIDAAEAKARLIDEAVRAQLPPGADSALVDQIRAEVAAMLEGDPVFDRLLS